MALSAIALAAAVLVVATSGVAGATPALVATPSSNLTDGQVVQVSGSGLPPSTSFTLMECAAGSCDPATAVPASSNASGVMAPTPYTAHRFITLAGAPNDCAGGTGCGLVAVWGGPPVFTSITFAVGGTPTLVATPSTNLTDGQVVQVSGSGLQPSTSFSLRECTVGGCAAAAVPASSNASGVMSPTPFTIQQHITVAGAPHDCAGGTGCGIVAIWGGPPVSTPIAFAPVPRATSLALNPPDSTNVVGTTHTVTATVLDQFGAPMPGITVRVSVSGSVSANESCTSAGDGTCDVSYAGPDFPGADAIVAFADSDGDGAHDAGEPSAEATKAWVFPESTTGHVTGGGQVLNAAATDEVAFGFDAKNASGGPKGGCNLVDPAAANTKVTCLDVTTMVVNGDSATLWGNATVNGAATSYRIEVTDNGEPGTSDSFRITTSSGYAAGGTLRRGNVQTH